MSRLKVQNWNILLDNMSRMPFPSPTCKMESTTTLECKVIDTKWRCLIKSGKEKAFSPQKISDGKVVVGLVCSISEQDIISFISLPNEPFYCKTLITFPEVSYSRSFWIWFIFLPRSKELLEYVNSAWSKMKRGKEGR